MRNPHSGATRLVLVAVLAALLGACSSHSDNGKLVTGQLEDQFRAVSGAPGSATPAPARNRNPLDRRSATWNKIL